VVLWIRKYRVISPTVMTSLSATSLENPLFLCAVLVFAIVEAAFAVIFIG
jgi:hypothetical protein